MSLVVWIVFFLKMFLIYKFVSSQILVFYFAGVVVGWGIVFCLEIFAACENSQVHCSSPLVFRLLQTLRFLFPPLISLFFIQPFNRHLRPLIGHDLSFASPPPPPPYLYKALFLSFIFISHPISSFCSPPSPFLLLFRL